MRHSETHLMINVREDAIIIISYRELTPEFILVSQITDN